MRRSRRLSSSGPALRAAALVALACAGALSAGRLAAGAGIVGPRDLPRLDLWLDAADVDGDGNSGNDPADGTTIDTWADKSGNGNDATQGTPADRPSFETNELGGRPVVRFASSDFMDLSADVTAMGSTVFIIFRQPGTAGWVEPFGGTDPGYLHLIRNDETRCLHKGSGDQDLFTGVPAATWAVQTVRLVSGDYRLWVDGTLTGPSGSTQTIDPFGEVGGDLVGDVAEVVIYGRTLSEVERLAVEDYLYGKWFAASLVAHYELDETSPGAVVNSASPGTDDGVNSGAVIDLPGKVGGAYEFDGTAAYVAADPADWTASAYTVALWAKAAVTGQPQYSSVFNNNSATNDFQIGMNGGVPQSYRWRAAENHLFGEVTTEWVHLAVTWDGATLRLFYDGAETASAALAPGNAGEEFAVYEIGRNRSANQCFEGLIDDVRVYDRALRPEEVADLVGGVAAGLAAHWRLDESSGATAADSADGNDGTLSGGAAWRPTGGMLDGALYLDGVNDQVTAAGYKGVTGTGARTVAAWIKTTDETAPIVSWGTNVAGEKYVFRVQNTNGTAGAIRVEVNGGNVVGRTRVANGQWHHVAAVLPPGSADVTDHLLYVDGVFDGTSATTGQAMDTASGDDVRIGRDVQSRFFAGLVDDVRIYERALSAGEVLELAGGPASGLVAHWELDDGAGTQALDSTPNGNTGTLTSMDPATDWVEGHVGSDALDFDGVDDFVELPPGMVTTDRGTVMMWVNTGANFTDNGHLFYGTEDTTGDGNGSQNELNLSFNDSEQVYLFIEGGDAGGDFTITTPEVCADGTWHHVAATWNIEGEARLYLDGVSVASTTHEAESFGLTNTIRLGRPISAQRFYAGLMDDVRLYNRDLSAVEVLEIFSRGNVEVSPAAGVVTTEAGGQGTFSVVLLSAPTADVTIDVTSSDTGEGVVEGAVSGVLTLTFTPGDWDSAQTVTVTGVDDTGYDRHVGYTVDLAATSADADFDERGNNVLVVNRDDEMGTNLAAWWRLDETSGLTAVNSASPGLNDGTLVGDPTWQPSGGMIEGALDLDGAGDYVDVGDGFADFTGGFTVTVWAYPTNNRNWARFIDLGNGAGVDNIVFTRKGTSDDVRFEIQDRVGGGTGTLDIAAVLELDKWQHFAATIDDLGDAVVYKDGVQIGAANIGVPGIVGRTRNYIGESNWGGDDFYEGQTDEVRIYDRALSPAEVRGVYERGLVTVRPLWGLVTTEAGGTASFEVYLNRQPAAGATVTIAFLSDNTAEGDVSGAATLEFTDATWNAPQSVTIAGLDDDVDDGDVPYRILTSCTAVGDAAYDGIDVEDVAFVNSDDDAAGIAVSPSSGLVTTEAGAGTATFTVALTSEPLSPVTVDIVSESPGEGTVAPTSLVFTASGATAWDLPQEVTVTGVDDFVDDGDIGYVVSFTVTSADTLYDGFALADVAATNVDNDTAGISVDPPSGLVTTEAGAGTATFTVRLDSEPLETVQVNVASSDASEGTVAPGTFVFTDANWSTGFTVTVTGVDDALGDRDVPYYVDLGPAASADPRYQDLTEAVALVNIDDEPVVSVTLTSPPATVNEDDAPADVFTVERRDTGGSLVATGDLVVRFQTTGTATRDDADPADRDYGLLVDGATPIPFDQDLFTIPDGQSSVQITVAPLNDDYGEGAEDLALALVMKPAPGEDYSRASALPETATIADDEPVVTVVATQPSASEPSSPGAFTVSRDPVSWPGVTVWVRYHFEGGATEGVDFTDPAGGVVPIPWDLGGGGSATVTVTPVDDRRQEGPETVILVIEHVENDPACNYSTGTPARATATIADDERPGIFGGTGCLPGGPRGAGGERFLTWLVTLLAAAAAVRGRRPDGFTADAR